MRRSLANALELLGAIGRSTIPHEALLAPTLVVAPHPDDEVLGCGGTIAIKSARGVPVRVVIMTDGQASHRGLIEASELTAIRKAEALRAATELGLSQDDYDFLDLPDHDLASHHAAAVDAMERILSSFAPGAIFIPHRRDRLEDHVATNVIVREALSAYSRPASVFEYPVWLWHTWPWTAGRNTGGRLGWARELVDIAHLAFFCRTRIDIGSVIRAKERSIAAYRSQVERRGGDPRWPVLADVSDGEFLACFGRSSEIFLHWMHEPESSRE